MESTGQKGKIQVSEATAQLITAAGHSEWLKKRSELVEAKGKGKKMFATSTLSLFIHSFLMKVFVLTVQSRLGTMQTYWVEPKGDLGRAGEFTSSAGSDRDSSDTSTMEEKLVNYLLKHERGKKQDTKHDTKDQLAELDSKLEL